MDVNLVSTNGRDLAMDLDWVSQILDARLKSYFEADDAVDVTRIQPPDLDPKDSIYASFIDHYEFSWVERVAFVIAMAPHVKPQLLDVFFAPNSTINRGFTEFGGQTGKTHGASYRPARH